MNDRKNARKFLREVILPGAISIALILGVIGCVLGLVAVPVYYSDKAECEYTADNSGAETKFVKNHIGSWDCYVKVDGSWIPLSKWRGEED